MNQYWINFLMLSNGEVYNIPCTDSLNWKEVTKTVNTIKREDGAIAIFVYDDNHKLVHHEVFVDSCGQKVPQKPFVMTEPSRRHSEFTFLCIQSYAKYGHEYWTKGSVYKGEYIGAKSCIVETNFGDKKRVGLGCMLCDDGIDKYFRVVEEE